MSFSQPKLENPCTRFISFKGDEGVWYYYDKELEKKVALIPPVCFIVLDQLSTITGYSDEYQSGIYSNEVHSLTKETLRVRTFKGGFSAVGTYANIKGEIASAGGKFTKSVYAMIISKDEEPYLANFQISGAAFSSWLDLKFSAQRHIVCITGENIDNKKGAVKFKRPVFRTYNMDSKYVPAAIEMDMELQKYLSSYKEKKEEEIIEKATVIADPDPEPVDSRTKTEKWFEENYQKDKQTVYGGKKFEMEDNPENDLPF